MSGEFDKHDVELFTAISVLSDQSRRVDKRLSDMEDKMDENGQRLTRLETTASHQGKSWDTWVGWFAAAAIVILQVIVELTLKR